MKKEKKDLLKKPIFLNAVLFIIMKVNYPTDAFLYEQQNLDYQPHYLQLYYPIFECNPQLTLDRIAN